MRTGRDKKQIDPNLKPEELARQAYAKAIRLLGSREHSSAELRRKLGDNGFSTDTIDATLEELGQSGYQSDERFAHLFAESLLRKNYGPLAINAKLSERGIDTSLARDAMHAALVERGVDWSTVASDALLSKFSNLQLAASLAAKSGEVDQNFMGKCARFLNRRGFSSTDSIKAIRLASETVSEWFLPPIFANVS